MRVLVCDDHVVFAESLACLLVSVGHDAVGVTHHPDEALAVLRRTQVDICLLDVMFGADSAIERIGDIRNASPRTRTVLLSGQIDHTLVEAGRAAGVRGIADKRQPIAEILAIIERVQAGDLALPDDVPATPVPPPLAKPANDAQRLAAFLTPREREVLGALVCGRDTDMIAEGMGIAAATVRCHIQSVLAKMGTHSRLEAATAAVRYGMIDPQTGSWLVRLA